VAITVVAGSGPETRAVSLGASTATPSMCDPRALAAEVTS
jgi:hypothetical protein